VPVCSRGASIEFDNVSVNLGGVSILRNVTAKVAAQSRTAIVGPNGAGKTTLLMCLLGEIPYSGKIVVSLQECGSECNSANSPLHMYRKVRVGFVPQRMAFDRSMPLTALEFLCLQRQRRPLWLGMSRSAKQSARELLVAVRAEHLESRMIGNLSGGELQRLLLANALGQTPDLLILDEPASGVDVQGEQLFCELLENVSAEFGFTQLMVSHDLSTVLHHATQVICLNKTVISQGVPSDALSTQTLMALFGLHMGLVDDEHLAAHISGQSH